MSTRHTVRDFAATAVPRAVIEACIQVAGRAPSGANHQPWHFVAVSDAAMKRRIRLAAEAEEQSFYAGKAGEEWLRDLAPLGTDADKPFLAVEPWLIVVFAERYLIGPARRSGQHYHNHDSVGHCPDIMRTTPQSPRSP